MGAGGLFPKEAHFKPDSRQGSCVHMTPKPGARGGVGWWSGGRGQMNDCSSALKVEWTHVPVPMFWQSLLR